MASKNRKKQDTYYFMVRIITILITLIGIAFFVYLFRVVLLSLINLEKTLGVIDQKTYMNFFMDSLLVRYISYNCDENMEKCFPKVYLEFEDEKGSKVVYEFKVIKCKKEDSYKKICFLNNSLDLVCLCLYQK